MCQRQNIVVGNDQYVGLLFVIPAVINLQGHRIEVYALVPEIHDNEEMVMGIKNAYEIEGIISTRDSCLHFFNRSITFLLETDVLLKPREQRFIKSGMPFIDDISRVAMIRLFDLKMECTNTIKVKFMMNIKFLM